MTPTRGPGSVIGLNVDRGSSMGGAEAVPPLHQRDRPTLPFGGSCRWRHMIWRGYSAPLRYAAPEIRESPIYRPFPAIPGFGAVCSDCLGDLRWHRSAVRA